MQSVWVVFRSEQKQISFSYIRPFLRQLSDFKTSLNYVFKKYIIVFQTQPKLVGADIHNH